MIFTPQLSLFTLGIAFGWLAREAAHTLVSERKPLWWIPFAFDCLLMLLMFYLATTVKYDL